MSKIDVAKQFEGSPNHQQIPVFCTPVIRRDLHRPSLCYVDVTFLESQTPLDALIFQNFYTSSISINMQTSPTTFIPILENRIIMESPYTETGGQTWVTIHASEFRVAYEKGRTLRIMLIQPSTMWSSFEIRHLSAVGRDVSARSSLPLKPSRAVILPSISAMTSADLAALAAVLNNEAALKAREMSILQARQNEGLSSAATSRPTHKRKQQPKKKAAAAMSMSAASGSDAAGEVSLP